MSFKTCKKLSFDCTLKKLDFNVTFEFILLFLILGSSLCECPSTETSPSARRVKDKVYVFGQTPPQTCVSAQKRQSRHDAEPQQDEQHLEELLPRGVEFVGEDF